MGERRRDRPSRILGISCDFHDAAAALVVDGVIVAAAEEERFSRVKHDPDLPARAIAACLMAASMSASDVDVVVFHEKPFLTAGRFLATRQRVGPRAVPGFVRTFPTVASRNLLVRYRLGLTFAAMGCAEPPPLRFSEHHLSHAAAAFYPSPFDRAAILNIDGVGEWATATFGAGVGHRIDLLGEQRFPDSVGLLYSLITLWCGFAPNDGEYKLMGLAPFGKPRHVDALRELAMPLVDGSLAVDARAVGWWVGDPRRRRALRRVLGEPRLADDPIGDHHADLAASAQQLIEEVVLRAAAHVADRTGESRLCLAGGVALNCVANGRLIDEGPFDDVWVQPAAGDAGSAVGSALWWWHDALGNQRSVARTEPGEAPRDGMAGAALGPSFSSEEVGSWLAMAGVPSRHIPHLDERCELVAERLAEGAVVGWFDGPMEFGPRALGRRSILADPRAPTMQSELNLRVKGRESFRPFAPAVLWEAAAEWFELDRAAPYMTFTRGIRSERLLSGADEPSSLADRVAVVRSEIPACTHIDGSARVQTVHREQHPSFHRLLEMFGRRTGCPVLLNTSFNRAGEPIVCTPSDALRTARAAGLDVLVLEDHVVEVAEIADVGADDVDLAVPWRATPEVGTPPGRWAALQAWAARTDAPGRIGRLIRAIARGSLRVGVIVAGLVRVVAFSLLAIVAVVLPWGFQRLLVLDPLESRRDRESRWMSRRRLDSRPERPWTLDSAINPPRPLRRARVALAVVLIPAVVWVVGRRAAPEIAAPRVGVPAAYANARWWPEYRQEMDYLNAPEVWNPFRLQRVHDLDMRYIDVQGGVRRTWEPPPCDCETIRMWLYGGSAVFGLGQRNEHTIASELARLADADGIRLVVVNRGVPGDTHWDSALRFNWDLGLDVAPDVVAFYDGQNDLVAASIRNGYGDSADRDPVSLVTQELRASEDEGPGPLDRVVDRPDSFRLIDRPESREPDGEALARRAVADYELARRLSRQGSSSVGIDALWFWQPVRVSRPPIEGEPRQPPGNERAQRVMDRAARAGLPEDVIDLAPALTTNSAPLFYDDVHHNEEASLLVAEAMWRRLRPTIEKASS